VLTQLNNHMKKSALWLCLAATITISTSVVGCKARKTGTVAKNSPVPASSRNVDSSGTTPSVKLTPTPVPNVRPNPIPNPLPPNPPM
jgi:hypothetical protein